MMSKMKLKMGIDKTIEVKSNENKTEKSSSLQCLLTSINVSLTHLQSVLNSSLISERWGPKKFLILYNEF